MPTYQYNPHQHVKIWLSNKPSLFMNSENQMRLIEMRECNPRDSIHFIYDSSLLNDRAMAQLAQFCKEHTINAVDVRTFEAQLTTDREQHLYAFYQDEIKHLHEGGNLAVASDILRWLSPVYQLGTYTDFDVPVDTSQLPAELTVTAPLLLNIGSLKVSGKEVILSNNDYIAIVDPVAAQDEIAAIQDGFISVLEQYSSDFVSASAKELSDSFLNRFILNFMKNRSESVYIARSNTLNPRSEVPAGSRELRHFIQQTMTDTTKFLNFKRKDDDSDEQVIAHLRQELSKQLGFVKWLFFGSEYKQIKQMLTLPDKQLLETLMKKERSLYLKSIVVCTTGPIAIANFLFKQYICSPEHFSQVIQPYSFNHYALKQAFQSKNSINMHENILGMMNFLGAEDGLLNDSSWLEEGVSLQKNRDLLLCERQQEFKASMAPQLINYRTELLKHLLKLQAQHEGFWGFLFAGRRIAKINALTAAFNCFSVDDENQLNMFHITRFKEVLADIKNDNYRAYGGLFSSRTQQLITDLQKLTHQAIIFGFSSNKQISLNNAEDKVAAEAEHPASLTANAPYQAAGISFFNSAETDKQGIQEQPVQDHYTGQTMMNPS